jgi:hypothetical protein
MKDTGPPMTETNGNLTAKPEDPEEYVTVAEFIEPVFAQMARGALESAGIESFLEGEHGNNMLGPAFWARLQVHRRDEEAAREILEQAEDNPEEAEAAASEAEAAASDSSNDKI